RRARAVPCGELARQHRPGDRQPDLRASDGAGPVSRRPPFPARIGDPTAWRKRGRLRPRHRLAAVSRGGATRVQGVARDRAARAQPRARRPAAGDPVARRRSRPGDPAADVARREPVRARPAPDAQGGQGGARPGGAQPELQCVLRRALAVPVRHACAAQRALGLDRNLDALRRVECGDLRRAGRRRAPGGRDGRPALSRGYRRRAPQAQRIVVPGRVLHHFAASRLKGETMKLEHAVSEPTLSADTSLRGAIIRLARGASIETSTRNIADVAGYAQLLAPGTDVHVTFLPGTPYHHVLSTATRLRQVGLNPVPHLAARRFASAAAVADFAARLRDEAGVGRVLLIAGDSESAAGPFESSLQVLETGVFEACGIRSIGIAGYPEGHGRIPQQVLDDALERKIRYA